ncbi:pyruvate dehydrogenase E2 component (dihydrolipoamide acetyltransferase) [Nocardioides sp. BE266]|uniref:dihydrolipoamide acetyltransferase family protein n=1 Tax=Nocardioides sp. BE266 TaxID=2817725 RepID=UPI002861755A|nr:dihydrolipoamide acetyltransferase family protein [Nocardioides sp. BE266]MDR7255532.1 pyruvate dehydrogenase E2 component (dihydrolipoamide acetyltransferase) [Nocardioides sp. BE266]
MARLAIRMPKMSMTMTEGEVNEWMVRVGDEVSEGDVVCEVMTDKVDMEVESTVSGTLVEIVVESGTVAVGEPIGWVEGEDTGGGFGDLLAESAPEPAAAEAEPVPAAPEPVAEAPAPTSTGPVAAVPRARALAREHGVDLATVTGTGPDGLVRVPDVEQLTRPAPAAPPPPTPAAAPAAPAAPAASLDRTAKIRAAVARKMTESAAVPQFTVWRDVLLDTANARRDGISWTTVLLQAYAAALREVPELLSRWDVATSTAAPSGPPAIALAVATPGGLMVPVFTEPDARDPRELDAEVKAVVAAVHAGRLDPSYLGLANGALSNLGGLGVDRFQALVTPPQASVLALGSIAQRPVAVPGGVGLALSVTAGLTVDHRVGDGAHAAQLLQAFVSRLDHA